jgi:hypothetical protein
MAILTRSPDYPACDTRLWLKQDPAHSNTHLRFRYMFLYQHCGHYVNVAFNSSDQAGSDHNFLVVSAKGPRIGGKEDEYRILSLRVHDWIKSHHSIELRLPPSFEHQRNCIGNRLYFVWVECTINLHGHSYNFCVRPIMKRAPLHWLILKSVRNTSSLHIRN